MPAMAAQNRPRRNGMPCVSSATTADDHAADHRRARSERGPDERHQRQRAGEFQSPVGRHVARRDDAGDREHLPGDPVVGAHAGEPRIAVLAGQACRRAPRA